MADLLVNDESYFASLEQIKREIVQSRSRAMLAANSELVCMYWRIGHNIDVYSEWGSKHLQSLSHDICLAFPGVKGFSVRNLKYMLKFAREFDYEIVQQLVAQIPWGHIVHLMDKVASQAERLWYVREAIENGWSRAVLMHQVSIDLYGCQAVPGKVNNFSRLLPAPDSEMVEQAMKDPYVFDFAVDGELCGEHDNPTVGLLLCKTKNDAVAEYSLRSVASPIGVSAYQTYDELPEDVRGALPSPEDILSRI